MKKILLAGATGYLGKHILKALMEADHYAKAIVRNSNKIANINGQRLEVIRAEVTDPVTLKGLFDDVDTVISTVGITRQKDGVTYDQVDYQANLNLLTEAKHAGVRKFIFVSVLNGNQFRELKICAAKERFVDALKTSGMDYTVIRPNGFFSDMTEFLEMAKKGSIYLFGDGSVQSNPIHGEDLACVCVEAITMKKEEILIGGPETLTQMDIAKLAFAALGKPVSVVKIPDTFRRIALSVLRIFTPVSVYGPLEFFLTVMSVDMLAPKVGKKHLSDFFIEVADKGKVNKTNIIQS